MIQTRQKTSIEFSNSSTSDFTSQNDVAAVSESTIMNKTSDTFDTQTIKALVISNYAALQRELN
jgi:hypothetical protein